MSKTTNIISEVDSDIEHIVVDGSLRHVVRKMILVANDPTIQDLSTNGFVFLGCGTRKIKDDEFDGRYEGKLYTFHYIRYLD